jgi:NAD(P)H-hydrate epimerase
MPLGTTNIIENTISLWASYFPFVQAQQHKYNRGHVVVSGGGIECTGAACLAANSALRVGAGVVTVLAPVKAQIIYAIKLTSVMTKPYKNIKEFKLLIEDPRKNVVLLGPGNGVNNLTLQKTKTALFMNKTCVIDADAITVFEGRSAQLFNLIKSPVVITPHEGEFKKLFENKGSRIENAFNAAKQSKAVIVLKGAETIIAAPDGRIVINKNAPATLATAGTGDVLSGIIAGLMAQGMEFFWAACCGVWLHSKCAKLKEIGLISEDLPDLLPHILKSLQKELDD